MSDREVQRTTYKGEPTILFARQERALGEIVRAFDRTPKSAYRRGSVKTDTLENHKDCGTRLAAKHFRFAARHPSTQVTARVAAETQKPQALTESKPAAF